MSSDKDENLNDMVESKPVVAPKKTATEGQKYACERARDAKKKKLEQKQLFNNQLTCNLENLYKQVSTCTESVHMVNSNVNLLLKSINELNHTTNWVPFDKKTVNKRKAEVLDEQEPVSVEEQTPPAKLSPMGKSSSNDSFLPNDSTSFLVFLGKVLGVAGSLAALYGYKQINKSKHPSEYLYANIN